MKKALTIVLAIVLVAGSAFAQNNETNTTQPVIQKVVTETNSTVKVDANVTSDINATKDTNASVDYTKAKPNIGKTIVQIIGVPIFAAGLIVTAIVVSPVWLVKTMFGDNKK